MNMKLIFVVVGVLIIGFLGWTMMKKDATPAMNDEVVQEESVMIEDESVKEEDVMMEEEKEMMETSPTEAMEY